MKALAALAASAVLVAACGGDDGPPRLVVSAAASLGEPLRRCSERFTGADVRLSFGGSDELAAQIRRGVEPDLFLAANAELPEQLARERLIDRPVTFARNELVLAVPASSATAATVEDLARPGLELVIGSESVPVGAYTRAALSRLPERVERNILANVRSEEPDVKGVVGKLRQGAADAGFVYRTDAVATGDEVQAISLPGRLRPDVAYAGGVVTGAQRSEDARRYLDGLLDGPCARELRSAGFKPPG